VDGVVTGASVGDTLTGYSQPTFVVIDPTNAGGGAVVDIAVTSVALAYATSGVFADGPGQGEAGDVIRMGGRIMQVTEFLSPSDLVVNVLRNEGQVIQDDPLASAVPAYPGQWSIGAPVSTIYGLNHLEGMTVSILADGVVVTPQVVAAGTITLPQAASKVVVGLGFTAQVQTLYWDAPAQGGTVQGRRKEIDQVIARVQASGLPFSIGVNQPDAAAQPGGMTVPWANLTDVQGPSSANNPLQPNDLFTGDIWCNVADQLGVTGGQVAVQQSLPLPLNLLAALPYVRLNDDVDA
jgi:hypothetical protein